MKNDIVYLISEVETQDEDGFPIREQSELEVYGEIKSVRYSEFYQASAIGIKASLVVSVNYDDYTLLPRPSLVRFEDVTYKIIRTYRVKKDNSIELTLSEVEGNG